MKREKGRNEQTVGGHGEGETQFSSFLSHSDLFAEDRFFKYLTHFLSRTIPRDWVIMSFRLFCQPYTPFSSCFLSLLPQLHVSLPRERAAASCHHYHWNRLQSLYVCQIPFDICLFRWLGQTPALWIHFRRNLTNMTRRVTFLIWNFFWIHKNRLAATPPCDRKRFVCHSPSQHSVGGTSAQKKSQSLFADTEGLAGLFPDRQPCQLSSARRKRENRLG